MNHLKRSLLFVPLLAVAMFACAASYAHASPPDRGGFSAQHAATASLADVKVAPAPLGVAPEHASAIPADVSHAVARAFDVNPADDRRGTAVFGSPCYDKNDARGCPPYNPGLTTLTYSTVTITADGATIARPMRLNC